MRWPGPTDGEVGSRGSLLLRGVRQKAVVGLFGKLCGALKIDPETGEASP